MISKFVIFVNILLASVVLAVPSSSRLEARLARRREHSPSNPTNHINARDGASNSVQYRNNRTAGAVREEREVTFTYDTATFTVPHLTGSDGSAGSVWVGIDSDSCLLGVHAVLQAGVEFTIDGGKASYDAWCAWTHNQDYDFDGFNISAGDKIRTTVTASSQTSGKAIIDNLSTNQTVTKELSSSYPVCVQDADWIIEAFEDGAALVNFGTVEFSNATASDSRGTRYTPDGATIYDIRQNDEVLTSVSARGDTLTVRYV